MRGRRLFFEFNLKKGDISLSTSPVLCVSVSVQADTQWECQYKNNSYRDLKLK